MVRGVTKLNRIAVVLNNYTMIIDEIITINQNSSCCCPTIAGEDHLIHDYWCQVNTCVKKAINDGYSKELFGYNSECAYNSANNFFYLLDLLLFIQRDMAMTGNTIDYYKDKYNIECVKKTFLCHGCNISNALAIFGMEKNLIPIPCQDLTQIPAMINCVKSSSMCSESRVSFTPQVNTENTYITWSRNTITGITQAGTTGIGSILEALTNTTGSPIVVPYTIYMTYNGNTTTSIYNVTVNPIPVLTSATTVTNAACSCGSGVTTMFQYVPISNVAGTTFTWSRPSKQTCPSGTDSGATGTGAINEAIDCNVEESYPIVYTYTLTSPDGCQSTATVTVHVYYKNCTQR